MRVRTRFRIVWAVSSCVTFVLAFGLTWSLRATRKADACRELSIALQQNVLERIALSDEFFLFGETRARVHWERKSAQLAALLDEAVLRFDSENERSIVADMVRGLEGSRVLFEEILKTGRGGTTEAEGQGRDGELRRRLTAVLHLTSFDLYGRASALTAGASRRMEGGRQLTLLLACLLIGPVLALIANGLLTDRLLERRITRLRAGTKHLAAGDLGHRVAIDDDDELAELGQAFDKMAAELQHAYGTLETQAAKVATLNRELSGRVAQLEDVNRELETFSYSVSHDLRAPLRHVIGFVELLEERSGNDLGADSKRYLSVISEAAKRMGVLIDDLLAFSRMGRAEMMQRRISSQLLVDGVVRDLADQTAGRGILWDIAALPEVVGDESMLRQVWFNLIANALKFSKLRAPARIAIGAIEADPQEVHFFVRDNGVGFDMRHVGKLFGVFQRLHAAGEFEGTGVGLAIVQRILNRHGGRIWAEGTPDLGATFWFSLPRKGSQS